MAYTAANEHYGASMVVSISADHPLRLPTRQGGARLVKVSATTTGLAVTLPDATLLRAGGDSQYVVCVAGSNAIAIEDSQGGTVQGTAAVGTAYELILADNSTAAGTWIVRSATYALGTELAIIREPYEVTIATSGLDFNLATRLTALGWDGTSRVSARVTVADDVVLGASSTAAYAFSTGSLPAGSTLLLYVGAGAYISGMGGNGAQGAYEPPGVVAQPGGDGGHALYIGCDTNLVNYGTIQGGGGGGGGGDRLAGTAAGGGGGGGAGQLPSAGGPAGSGGGAMPGLAGTLYVAGGGGSGGYSGGTGGAPGTAGDAGSGAAGGAGGAAGNAVHYVSTVTWNKIRSGSIGSEVPV